jgi:hypothetical protein
MRILCGILVLLAIGQGVAADDADDHGHEHHGSHVEIVDGLTLAEEPVPDVTASYVHNAMHVLLAETWKQGPD